MGGVLASSLQAAWHREARGHQEVLNLVDPLDELHQVLGRNLLALAGWAVGSMRVQRVLGNQAWTEKKALVHLASLLQVRLEGL